MEVLTTVLGPAVGLAALWLLGACLLTLLDARGRGVGGVAVDFVAGVVVLAFVGTMAVALRRQISPVVIYALLTVALAACAATRAWKGLPKPRLAGGRIGRDPFTLGVLGTAILMLSLVLTAATHDRLWWDGWSIWTFKARVLFLEGMLPTSFLVPGGVYDKTNLDYPLAVPLLDWWLYRHAGEVVPALASFAGAIWFALLPALAWSALRDRVGPRTSAAVVLGLSAFWPVAFFATGGTADVVIAVGLLGALLEVERAVSTRERGPLVRAACFLSLAALAKNEGAMLAAAALVIAGGALLFAGERRYGRLLWLALPLALLAPWAMFTRSLSIASGALTATGPAEGILDRLPIFFTGLRVLFSSSPWLPVPLLAALGVYAVLRCRTPGLLAGWLLVGVYAAGVSLVYLASSADMIWLLSTSAPRVFGVLVPPLVCLAVLSISESERHRPSARFLDLAHAERT